jgi:hypothetical protein
VRYYGEHVEEHIENFTNILGTHWELKRNITGTHRELRENEEKSLHPHPPQKTLKEKNQATLRA